MMLQMESMDLSKTTASDGFFLNLSWVTLLLSAPFATSKGGVNPKLMGVDPGYCTLGREVGEGERYGGAVVDFSQETKMSQGTSTGSSAVVVNKCMLSD